MKAWYKRNKVGLRIAQAWIGLIVAVLGIFLALSVIQYPLLGVLGVVWFLSIWAIINVSKGKNG